MTLLAGHYSPASQAEPWERADAEPVMRALDDSAAIEHAKADLERLLALRSKMGELERTRVDDDALPTHPALGALLPGGGLQPGGVYSLGGLGPAGAALTSGSTSLLMALLAGPSADGAWCAVVGMPGFSAEAAARSGVDLERLVLVPHPGDRWFSVTAALADAVSVVVTSPRSRVGDAEAARLAARLRQRGAVLLVCGPWPRVDATVGVASSAWSGVGEGHGYLAARELTVTAESRSWGRERRATLLLTPDGRLQDAAPATKAQHPASLHSVRAGQSHGNHPAAVPAVPRRLVAAVPRTKVAV
ncbi:hypothetical protein ACX9R5_11470 [Rathayibacter sp. CAU 1779]